MRDYGKVYSRIWESDDFRSLSDDGRMLVMYLLTCQHGTISGCFRVPDGYACEDMGWDAERVAKGFANLAEKGFANRCETTKWVWIVKFLQWNQPENPNQRKAAVKQALSVPENCAWRSEFLRICGPSLGIEQNPSLTVVEPFPNQKQKQEQEQEQDQKQEKPSASSAGKLPPCPHADLIGLYHELLPELPAVRLMNDQRKRALSKAWGWVLTSSTPEGVRRATTASEAVDWFRRYFERARDNDFLMGRTSRSGEHAGWRCDLDFLLTDKGMKQVIEKTQEAA